MPIWCSILVAVLGCGGGVAALITAIGNRRDTRRKQKQKPIQTAIQSLRNDMVSYMAQNKRAIQDVVLRQQRMNKQQKALGLRTNLMVGYTTYFNRDYISAQQYGKWRQMYEQYEQLCKQTNVRNGIMQQYATFMSDLRGKSRPHDKQKI